MSTKQTQPAERKTPRSLAEWRSARKWDQREAAEFLGISQTYYSRLERRGAFPRHAIATRVIARTGLPIEVVMGIAS